MSIPKSQRKESKFIVYNTILDIRKKVTAVVLNDFRYDVARFEQEIERRYRNIQNPTQEQLERKAIAIEKYSRLNEFFCVEEKKTILHYLRCLTAEVFSANSLYPELYEEAVERRLHQDRALAYLHLLNQELQYVIDSLPVSINGYLKLVDDIEKGLKQIKAWRKSDNQKLKQLAQNRATSDNSSNFANVNGNGNSNCNNASNVNGVRPIPHDGTKKISTSSLVKEGEVILPC